MDSSATSGSLLGIGVYTVSEAARLSAVPPTRIRRWLTGRSRVYQGQNVFDPPLWRSAVDLADGSLHLSFRDLIELRMVDRFRAHRLSMPYLRKVVSAAQMLIGDTHPFSTSYFKTDGRRLYLEVIRKTKEPELIEVLSGQHAFHSIISVGLKDVEFSGGIASLWTPESGRGDVVVDPERSFGQPVLAVSGVPTSTISMLSEAGLSVRDISRNFEITQREVRSALSFEERLAA